MHAATFGGNPIASAAGIATLETIEDEGLLERASQLGERFRSRLQELQNRFEFIDEIRVCGVMIGIQLSVDGAPFVKECLEKGLLINCTQGTVLRFLPAMNLSDDLFDEGCDLLESVFEQVAETLVAKQ